MSVSQEVRELRAQYSGYKTQFSTALQMLTQTSKLLKDFPTSLNLEAFNTRKAKVEQRYEDLFACITRACEIDDDPNFKP